MSGKGPVDDSSEGPALEVRRTSGVIRSALAREMVTLGAFIGVVLAWWLAAFVIRSNLLLPAPPAVAAKFWHLLVMRGQPYPLVTEMRASLQRILLGWGAGGVGGIAVGTLMSANRWVRHVVEPVVELFRPIPPLAFAPLLVIWFGIGEMPKVVIIVLTAFPVMVISTYAATTNINPNWKLVALSLGAGRWHVLRHVIIPAALPGILVGLRLASGLSWSTLVAAEIIASTSGLGWMILQAGVYLDTDTVFVGIVCIGGLAYFMDRGIRLVEARLVPWRGRV